MIKLGSCFSGIGAWESAFKRLGIEYELKWYFEKDKYASCSYAAIHGEDEIKNKWDIIQANSKELEDVDVLVYSPPCQAFSVAGKQLGIKDPRGMMFYHTLPIIKEKKPKICMMENVKGLVSGKFKELFKSMLEELENAGYNNHYKVLNSKDYGIPQNRERVFIVSIRKDIDTGTFKFPKGFDNGLRLKDFLENEVDKKFYMDNAKTEKLLKQLDYTNQDLKGVDLTINQPKFKDYANCIKARYDAGISNQKSDGTGVCLPCITPDRIDKGQNGRRFKKDGESMFTLTSQDRHGILNIGKLDIKGSEQVRRVYSEKGICPTIDTMQGGNRQPKILTNYRIRKLTPLECWRLQGFTDEEFQKAKQALNKRFYKDKDRSNSQLYKQAGNSITINVLVEIYKNLFRKEILK